MKTSKKIKKKENLPVKVNEQLNQTDESFIKQFQGKTYVETMFALDRCKEGICLNSYNYLAGCRYLELTGIYREGGFDNFKTWLLKRTFLTPSKYHTFLRVAYRFDKDIIEKITFDNLAWLLRRSIPANTMSTILKKITHHLEVNDEPIPQKELKSIVKSLEEPKGAKASKKSEVEILRIRLNEERRKRLEAEKKVRDLTEKLLKAEMALEEEKKYREDIQKGKRGI